MEMPGLLTLPSEILYEITSNIFLPDLQNLADSRLFLSRFCRPRILKHKRLQAFAFWDHRASEYDVLTQRPKLPYWKTLLLACLREPETIHYVKSLHGPDKSIYRDTAEKTFYVQQEPFFSPDECQYVRQAINESPWIRPDDEFDHLFEDNSFAGHESQLVPEWKTLDVLAILLPMLYNLEYLDLSWKVDEGTFQTRQDYISLLQVLRRINSAVLKKPKDNPWPRLLHLETSWMPKEMLCCVKDIPPTKTLHETPKYVKSILPIFAIQNMLHWPLLVHVGVRTA